MTQKVQRYPSSAPETFGAQKDTPTVTLDLDGGDTFEAVFPTDEAAGLFMRSLQDTGRRFASAQNEDGERKLFGVGFIKSAQITGIANPPEKTARAAVVGEVVPLIGSNLKSARLGAGGTAQVAFADGSTWEYAGVDTATFTEWINAESAGKFYDKSIRAKFAEKQV